MENNFNIAQRLEQHAQSQPDQLALIQPDENQGDHTLTYAQLYELTQGYVRLFSNHGVSAQDQALLLIPPGPEFYAVFLALMQLGVTAMLIDPGVGKAHTKACLHQHKPSLFIGTRQAQLLRLYPELRHHLKAFCPDFFPLTYRLKALETAPQPLYPAQENHPALITFTSGSTGRPKAILRTHGFLLQQGDALANLMQAPKRSVELCTFPVFVLANLSQGISTLLPPANTKKLSTANFAQVIQSIKKYKVTRLLAAPDFCNKLSLENAADEALKKIEHIHTGGGPVHMNLLTRLKKAATHAQIMALYGSTEAEPIALKDLSQLQQEDYQQISTGGGLPAGAPVDIVRLRIIEDQTGKPISALNRDEFDAMTLLSGHIGEIVVTGPLVQKGYMNEADNLETKFQVEGEVWHRTGDAGSLDIKGQLWLQGRCSAKVNIHGQTLYPFAIEAAAAIHAQVKRSAFVQVNNQNILAIECEKNISGEIEKLPKAIENQLMQNFPQLEKIIYLAHIPVDKRHHTKILYPELKNLLSSHQ